MSQFFESTGGGSVVPATSTTLGGVKIGSGVTVESDGRINVVATALGPISSWDTATTYGLVGTSVVYHNGTTWLSIAASGPSSPGGPQEPSDATPSYWQAAAMEGEVGPTGPADDDAYLLTLFLMAPAS